MNLFRKSIFAIQDKKVFLQYQKSLFQFCNQDLNKPVQKIEVTQENAHQIIDEVFLQLKWVKNNKVVLFMKGVPQMPQCGYSNFVVEILKFYKIQDYKSVDILKNNILREQVKNYSNWPTYPQLFIDGKLIGGCDIVNEMHKEGQLRELFVEAGLIK